jgi:phage repressor protein C with HTH and peptisase S24 domain
MNDLGTRLRQRRKELKLTQKQVAKSVGITASSVTQWELGATKPSGESLYALCKTIQCQPDWLLYGKGPLSEEARTQKVRQFFDIPVYGETCLAAGNGCVVDSETVTDHVPIDKTWIRDSGYKANQLIILKVKGASMSPRIRDGDLLLIDTSNKTIESGKVYAISANDELRVKRIHERLDNSWAIASDNNSPEHQDQIISGEQLNSLRIIGRAVTVLMSDL